MPLLLYVEGNIGVGKSSLCACLADAYPTYYHYVPEPVYVWRDVRLARTSHAASAPASARAGDSADDYNLLSKFYSDRAAWGRTFQQFVVSTRVAAVAAAAPAAAAAGTPVLLVERSPYTDAHIFAASADMSPLDSELYEQHWAACMDRPDLPAADGILYVRLGVERTLLRVRARGRPEENAVDEAYINQLHTAHEQLYYGTASRLPGVTDVAQLPVAVLDAAPNFLTRPELLAHMHASIVSFATDVRSGAAAKRAADTPLMAAPPVITASRPAGWVPEDGWCAQQ